MALPSPVWKLGSHVLSQGTEQVGSLCSQPAGLHVHPCWPVNFTVGGGGYGVPAATCCSQFCEVNALFPLCINEQTDTQRS